MTFFFRKATLLDVDYKIVAEVTVPSGDEWPEVIQHEGRSFAHYAQARPVPDPAPYDRTYREIGVDR